MADAVHQHKNGPHAERVHLKRIQELSSESSRYAMPQATTGTGIKPGMMQQA